MLWQVRSNSGGRTLGFLADARRLNVGITRAKRALLVVGHAASLQSVSKETVDKGAGDVKNYWPEYVTQENACVSRRSAYLPTCLCLCPCPCPCLSILPVIPLSQLLVSLTLAGGWTGCAARAASSGKRRWSPSTCAHGLFLSQPW